MSSRMERNHSNKRRPVARQGKGKKRKKKKKKNPRLRIFLLCLLLLSLLGLGYGIYYVANLFGSVKTEKIDRENVGIDSSLEEKLKQDGKDNIINIALFGIDEPEGNEPTRSDATMVLTIDKDRGKIKITSLMRDSYVKIDGHGRDKLNHAHAFGGPELTIKTINQNFNLNIEDFVSVNFADMQKIVDALGGIELTIRKDEIEKANWYINELAKIGKKKATPLTKTGKQKVNGMQALAYTRLRVTAGGDFERTERQRIVLQCLFDKIKAAGISEYPDLVKELLPMIKTSLSPSEMISLGTDIIFNGVTNLEQERFPIDGDFPDKGDKINGIWYLPFDEKVTKQKLHDYLFNDIKPKKGK
ncbi:LCP family protein [Clostridium sp.]|uniref:LCP family protein n=1 Tax=Clostridium sp. TaxID=1506 RepID=UPI003464CD35